MGKTKKDLIIKKKFKYKEPYNEYTIQLRKRHWWWLWLLLLLLLFIKCEHTITVECVDKASGVPIEGAQVSLDYTAHFLYNEGKFLDHRPQSYERETDEDGLAVFEDMPCSVFSYIFYCLSTAHIEALSDCYLPAEESVLFHYTSKTTLKMEPQVGLKVRVVDKDTDDDIPGAEVIWQLPGSKKKGRLITDENGMGIMEDGPICYGQIKRIDSKAKNYADTTYIDVDINEIRDSTGAIIIKMRPLVVDYHADIVMCIDNTGSMSRLIDMVKRNALTFHSDLKDYCAKKGQKIEQIRLRVISYGDLLEPSFNDSGLLNIPAETAKFQNFVSSIRLTNGEDGPEDGLEALAMAIKTPWDKKGTRRRHIIIVYTDATPHPLGTRRISPFYPKGMPSSFDELTSWWDGVDHKSRRLVLFAPEKEGWRTISHHWDNVIIESSDLNSVLSGKGYTKILEAISKSL